jgi:hypothetical protein
MGRCQSGFCTPRLMEILCEELGVTPEQVTKFGGTSNLLVALLAPRHSTLGEKTECRGSGVECRSSFCHD